MGQWEGDELPDKQHPRYRQQDALGVGVGGVVTVYLIEREIRDPFRICWKLWALLLEEGTKVYISLEYFI